MNIASVRYLRNNPSIVQEDLNLGLSVEKISEKYQVSSSFIKGFIIEYELIKKKIGKTPYNKKYVHAEDSLNLGRTCKTLEEFKEKYPGHFNWLKRSKSLHLVELPSCNIRNFPEFTIKMICTRIFAGEELYFNHRKKIYPYELDFYNASRNIAIEYDGIAFHEDLSADNRKNTLCSEAGITLYRIKEISKNHRIQLSEIIKILRQIVGIVDEEYYSNLVMTEYVKSELDKFSEEILEQTLSKYQTYREFSRENFEMNNFVKKHCRKKLRRFNDFKDVYSRADILEILDKCQTKSDFYTNFYKVYLQMKRSKDEILLQQYFNLGGRKSPV